uniref:Uncharacterized protein n=1 Tax=Timema shepardi TaxID=629360 RepID=A0A7R9G5N1_TIMSH|nr:unnamed protein product [Timema shepardi]
MYVIFPAEDVVDLTLGIVSPNNPAYPCLAPSVPSSNQRSAEQQDGPYQQYLHANTGIASSPLTWTRGIEPGTFGLARQCSPRVQVTEYEPGPQTRLTAAILAEKDSSCQKERNHFNTEVECLGIIFVCALGTGRLLVRSGGHWFHNKDDPSQDQVKQELPSSGKKEKKKKQQRTTTTKSRTQQGGKMATGGDVTLRELAHPALNEALKGHNSVTFKLALRGFPLPLSSTKVVLRGLLTPSQALRGFLSPLAQPRSLYVLQPVIQTI